MSDFINPTGKGVRISDRHGQGHFGASRGKRTHKGVDYVAEVGQDIKAVMSGRITKVGYPYGNDLSYRYVEISNDDTGYRIRQFYVKPCVINDDWVSQGDVIGVAQCLDRRYAGITEHVHLEIYKNGVLVDPTGLVRG